jgi:hypothetical protein
MCDWIMSAVTPKTDTSSFLSIMFAKCQTRPLRRPLAQVHLGEKLGYQNGRRVCRGNGSDQRNCVAPGHLRPHPERPARTLKLGSLPQKLGPIRSFQCRNTPPIRPRQRHHRSVRFDIAAKSPVASEARWMLRTTSASLSLRATRARAFSCSPAALAGRSNKNTISTG